MHETLLHRRSSAGTSVLAAVLAAGIGMTMSVALMVAYPPPAEAAGESWRGTVAWQGTGTVEIGAGITYTNNDVHRLEAPYSSDAGIISSKIDTTIVYPPPELGGCFVRKETYVGSGAVAGSFTVSDGGGTYAIHAFAADNVTVLQTLKWGGGILEDGTVCSDNDSSDITSLGPFVNIRSVQYAYPKYRGGASVTPSLQAVGGCAFYGASLECADMQSFKYRPGVRAQWSVSRNECTGFSQSWNIGDDDRLFLFNTCQTKNLSSRTSFLDDITGTPKVCDLAFVRRLGKPCTAYKAVVRTQWAQNDWFMYTAANTEACGVWVVDKASWRPPKIKPATRNSDGLAISYIRPGASEFVRTSSGSLKVTCPG